MLGLRMVLQGPSRTGWTSGLAFCLLLGVFATVRSEEPPKMSVREGPPVPIELYASGVDTDLPKVRQVVQEVLKKFPRLKLTEVDIDTESGRAAREKMEREHRIQNPGVVTLCIGPYHLVNRGDDGEIQTYFQYIAARIFDPTAGQGRLEPDPLPFAKRTFGEDVRVTPAALSELDGQRVFTVLRGDQPVGWVADLFRATRCPFCNDTQFLVAVKPADLSLLAIQPVRTIERYGKDVDADESNGFIKRLLARKPGPELCVDTVVGATRTCGAYQLTIQELWRALQIQQKGANDTAPRKADGQQ